MNAADYPKKAREEAQGSASQNSERLAKLASARLAIARRRSALYQQIREFFWQQDFCEVETPLISSAASTEPHLASMEVSPWPHSDQQEYGVEADSAFEPDRESYANSDNRLKRAGYLITSPEYPMKRLMAEWQSPIFQITKCFRALEQSSRHNPEFSMLEWYRPHAKLEAIEADLLRLLEILSGRPVKLERISYSAAFVRETGLDPFTLSVDEAQAFAMRNQLSFPENLDRLGWVDLLFSLKVEPALGAAEPENLPEKNRLDALPDPLKATLIHDFLPEQASLAQTQTDGNGRPVALRFELYLRGLEIANAASELTDPATQLRRFKADNQTRRELGLPPMPIDHNLIAAMQGLPPCSGIAVGLDRLLMVLGGFRQISEVLLFDVTRA